MQKRRGKAREVLSHAMTSSWQRVGRWGAVPDLCNSQTLALIRLESTKQRAVMALSFEHYNLKTGRWWRPGNEANSFTGISAFSLVPRSPGNEAKVHWEHKSITLTVYFKTGFSCSGVEFSPIFRAAIIQIPSSAFIYAHHAQLSAITGRVRWETPAPILTLPPSVAAIHFTLHPYTVVVLHHMSGIGIGRINAPYKRSKVVRSKVVRSKVITPCSVPLSG